MHLGALQQHPTSTLGSQSPPLMTSQHSSVTMCSTGMRSGVEAGLLCRHSPGGRRSAGT